MIIARGKALKGRRRLQGHGLNLLSAISLLAEIGDITQVRHVEATGLLREAGDLDEAVERDRTSWQDHEAGAQATAGDGHSGGAGAGESDEDAVDGVLSVEEAGEGAGKAICATARKLLTVVFVVLQKKLDYWHLEDRLYNRKLRALNAAT